MGSIGQRPPEPTSTGFTAGGRRQLQAETRNWEQTAAIIARFFKVKSEDLA